MQEGAAALLTAGQAGNDARLAELLRPAAAEEQLLHRLLHRGRRRRRRRQLLLLQLAASGRRKWPQAGRQAPLHRSEESLGSGSLTAPSRSQNSSAAQQLSSPALTSEHSRYVGPAGVHGSSDLHEDIF